MARKKSDSPIGEAIGQMKWDVHRNIKLRLALSESCYVQEDDWQDSL